MRGVLILFLTVLCVFSANPLLAHTSGTLLISEHSNRIVERNTGSPYTHVAVVFNENAREYVYQAAPPDGVTRQTIEEYLDACTAQKRTTKNMHLHVFGPKRPFTEDQVKKMLDYVKAQVGRPYSVQAYITGEPGEGIQCAELIGYMLAAAGLGISDNPGRLSPGDIVDLTEDIYEHDKVISATSSCYQIALPPSAYDSLIRSDIADDRLLAGRCSFVAPPWQALVR